jgi:small GTP-binding protein
VTPDGSRAVTGSFDRTARVWDLASGRCLATLEGHAGEVLCVAVTPDGSRAVTGSSDRTARVWTLPVGSASVPKAAGEAGYTNAKVLLVGDSGVGKSGLAIRLTEDRFEPTTSTDGVWATHWKLPHESRTGGHEREIWLWDFAGQADYRLIHQLFLDETALAILVFNPQSDNPFEGLGQWDLDLQRAARRPFRKILVAGRCDRGGLRVSRASIDQFLKDRRFYAYLETSAQTGNGCFELRSAIIDAIPWNEIPWTASTRTFKLLKETIFKLKDEGKVLLRLAELRQQLEMLLPSEAFTLDELRAVVGLLAGPGVVWRLEFGDFILLQPERVNAYAAAVVRKVRAHVEEIGVIPEEDVLAGKLDYQDMQRLPPDEESIVLRAMHQTFVDHGLCLREQTASGPLLIFPSYFKRDRPDLGHHPTVLVSYQFRGPLEEIYATLVVRLHHTAPFDKDCLWRFAADFKTPKGRRVGLKMTPRGEGSAEISVYFEADIPDETKVTFIKYVHEHLKARALDVVRQRHYVCPNPKCGEPVESLLAIKDALDRGKQRLLCQFCEKKIPLVDLIEQKFASPESEQRVRELDEQAQTVIDNESRELILDGHAFAIAGEADQIYRPIPNTDQGIDAEIEFKDYTGQPSGQRVYLLLRSGNSYSSQRQKDGAKVFTIKDPQHADNWRQQPCPVMLVTRISDGTIRWMNVSSYLKSASQGRKTPVTQVVFNGEPFTALNLQRMRDRLIPRPPE